MLNTQAQMASYDDFYEALLGAHQGLTTEESHAMNARLVLLLANHIGDPGVLQHALHIARGLPSAGMGDAATRGAAEPVPSHASR